jgi:WD40 repeat protein
MNIRPSSSNQRIAVSSTSKILLSGADLKLYELTDTLSLKCLITYTDVSYVKCLDWHPSKSLAALGFSTGRISIANIDAKAVPSILPTVSEFGPQHARSCTTIRFSPDGNHLLSGYEKVRSDYGLQVWDPNYSWVDIAYSGFTNPIHRRQFNFNWSLWNGGGIIVGCMV